MLKQTKGNVLIHRHVGIEGVVLEDHGDVPVLGGHIVHQSVADVQFAAADIFQPGDHPQGGGFAAARRAYQNNEFLVLNLQVQIGDDGHIAGVGFVDMLECNACHNP